MSDGQILTHPAPGTLIIIGGHEEKSAERPRAILRRVAESAGTGRLIVTSVASSLPEDEYGDYIATFHDLGVDHVEMLGLKVRDDAYDPAVLGKIESATAIFFTGGDQLRITGQLADTPAHRCLLAAHLRGVTIAGTSAGAAAMPDIMIAGGQGDGTYSVASLRTAPGLGLIHGVTIDSHFTARGRFGRLLAAVVERPADVGIGIDENTGIDVAPDGVFSVIGEGGVYIIDATGISHSGMSSMNGEGVVGVVGVKLHVLTAGESYDLGLKVPIVSPPLLGS